MYVVNVVFDTDVDIIYMSGSVFVDENVDLSRSFVVELIQLLVVMSICIYPIEETIVRLINF